MTGTFHHINGIRYHIRVQGNGPVLVLLHGFTGASDNWLPLLPRLSPHYTVIMPDLIGHGQTTSPPDATRYHMPQAAADLVALVEKLGFTSWHLLGYSMGGRLALYTALHYPQHIQNLILESASPGLQTEPERTQRREKDAKLANRIMADGIPAFVEFWENIPLFASQQRLPGKTRQRLRSQRLRNQPTGLANSLLGMGTGTQPSLWGELNTLRVPTRLICGGLDTKFIRINRQMHQQISGSTFTIIPETGHTTHLESPTEFVQIIRQGLA